MEIQFQNMTSGFALDLIEYLYTSNKPLGAGIHDSLTILDSRVPLSEQAPRSVDHVLPAAWLVGSSPTI